MTIIEIIEMFLIAIGFMTVILGGISFLAELPNKILKEDKLIASVISFKYFLKFFEKTPSYKWTFYNHYIEYDSDLTEKGYFSFNIIDQFKYKRWLRMRKITAQEKINDSILDKLTKKIEEK